MGSYTDHKDLARAQLRRSQRVGGKAKELHADMCESQYREGHKLLGGKVGKKQLKAMGHPYGRRAGKNGKAGRQRKVKGMTVRLDPLPINAQSSRLREGLRMRRMQLSKSVQAFAMSVLGVAYAKYVLAIGGTSRMITRPYWATLQKSFKKKNFDLLIKLREEQRKD